MTTATVPAPRSQPPATRPRYGRRRRDFGDHVAATIVPLQAGYRAETSTAIATAAQLRAAAAGQPGQHYVVLAETLVPDDHLEHGAGDEATDREHAKHTAVTLYALHQQSIRDKPMHVDGPGLGTAVSLLAKADRSADAVRRRFAALGTASTYAETARHLRSLVRQLRHHKIGLDYGLLAEDLERLRKPGGPADVRARWGRDYHRTAPATDNASPNEE